MIIQKSILVHNSTLQSRRYFKKQIHTTHTDLVSDMMTTGLRIEAILIIIHKILVKYFKTSDWITNDKIIYLAPSFYN